MLIRTGRHRPVMKSARTAVMGMAVMAMVLQMAAVVVAAAAETEGKGAAAGGAGEVSYLKGSQLGHFTILWGYCVAAYCLFVGIFRLLVREVGFKNVQAWKRVIFAFIISEVAKWMMDNQEKFNWISDIVYGVLSTILFLSAVDCYNKLIAGAGPRKRDMRGKVVVVTGANTGVGYETAKSLMRMGAHVIFACRNEEKANFAMEEIMVDLINEKAQALRLKELPTLECKSTFMQVDLASLASVRKFCAALLDKQHLGLDALVLNAGLMLSTRQVTEDGYEMTFAVNHLAHFLMANLLLDKLSKSSDPRIVVVTSSFMAKSIDFNDLQTEQDYRLFKAYSLSKLANTMFGMELQQRIDRANEKKRKTKGKDEDKRVKGGVLVNMAHPGIPLTNISRNFPRLIVLAYDAIRPLCYLFQKMPAHGAHTPVHLATSKDIRAAEVGGYYFFNCYPEPFPRIANDPEACAKLWDMSVEMVGGLALEPKAPKELNTKKDK